MKTEQGQVAPRPKGRRVSWLPFLFIVFLVSNWALVTAINLLNTAGYVSLKAASLATSFAAISLILISFGAIAASARVIQVKALWPTVCAAMALAVFARLLYLVLYPVGSWPGLWPGLSPEWERSITNSLIYAAEITLVAGFCRIVFALRTYIMQLKEEQRRLREEQEAHKRAEEQSGRLEQQLLQSQKMESIGRLAGGVAHDLNNMLTPVLAYATMLEADFPADSPSRTDLREIIAAAERARDLTRHLLAFARKQALEIKPVSLNSVIAGFEKMLRSSLREDIQVRFNLAAFTNIAADSGQIEQILMNLVLNAQDAMPNGGLISIETADVTLDQTYAADHEGVQPGPHVMLLISDTGEGMDTQTCEKIFEPFFTTKKIGKGVGLGLSTTHGIVKQHQGSIWVYSEPGQGTTFKIYFPVTDAPPVAPLPTAARPKRARGAGTVLIAEDNPQVRLLAARVLRANGFSVLEAEDGRSALNMANDHNGRLALLVSDVVMPDMNGRLLHEALAATRPDLRVLYMSGYSNNVIEHHGVLGQDVQFIQKPFNVEAFLDKVREALA